jgi:signal transduction histidine kinase
MSFRKTCLRVFILILFMGNSGFSQSEQSSHEDSTLELIESAIDAISDGDYNKSFSFLSLAKPSVDSLSSTYLLYKYYNTLGSLAFSRRQIAESQQAYAKAISAARKLQDTSFMVASYSGMANALLIDNKFKKALVYQNEALSMLKLNKNNTYYGLLSNMSIAYKQSQDFDNALAALLEVEKYFNEQNDLKSLAIVHNNLGELYRENFNDYNRAKIHYHKAVKFNLEINNKHQLSQNYHNLSLANNSLKQTDSAFYYVNKSIEIKTEIGDLGGLATNHHALGLIQLEVKQYDAAIKSFQKTLEISEQFGITPGLYYGNFGIGDAYLAKGNRIEALKYYKKVEEVVSQTDSFEMKGAIANKLVEFYKDNKDFEQALFYSEKLKAIEDSIASIKSNERLDELRVQYETSMAQSENEILREREASQQEQIRLQKVFLIILSATMVVLVFMLFTVIKTQRQKKSAYKEVSITSDELQKQYEIVKQRESELRRQVALKDKIFSVLGHDLRTPLANIAGLIDSMTQIDLTPDELQFMLKHLRGETNASLKTLENILQWARLQMNDKSVYVKELDEDEIIIELIKNFESNTLAKEINVSYKNESKSILKADENQFRSIANNLIANAIKFSPIKGEVKVNFKEEKDYFVFTVSDQGRGIDNSTIKNLETREELMSTYGTEGEKGTGIGLRIVKDFINLHNGLMEFSKNEPTGTIVTVKIPNNLEVT